MLPGGQFIGVDAGINGGVAPVVVPQQQNNHHQVAEAARLGGERPEQPDLLALLYKSIRFALLIMVLYLYSSVERFFAVVAILGVIWFVQQRRERQQAQPAHAELGNANNDAETPNPNPEAERTPQAAVIQPTSNTMNIWNVFWSTVTSFFASLIPENPVPININ